MFKFFSKKKTTVEIEMVELKLTVDNNLEPERLLGFMQRETKNLINHIDRVGKYSDTYDYTTPELLIASVVKRFKTFETILTFLMSVLQNHLKNNNTDSNRVRIDSFINKLNEHRNKIELTAKQLNNESIKQDYCLGTNLYAPVLKLRSVTWPLLKLMEDGQCITEVLPKPKRNEPKLNDVLSDYLKEIFYLPRQVYSTLIGMELSQQRSNQEYQLPSNSY